MMADKNITKSKIYVYSQSLFISINHLFKAQLKLIYIDKKEEKKQKQNKQK